MTANKQYKALLLDADNTVFDFDRCEESALAETLEARGLPSGGRELACYRETNDRLWRMVETGEMTRGQLKRERFALFFAHLAEKTDDAAVARAASEAAKDDAAGDEYIARLSEKTHLISGMLEVCRALSQKYKLYIITNGITSVQESRFARSEISALFDGVFISEKIGSAKPEKAFFDHVLRETGCSAAECLVIGDSPTSDIAGGKAAGIDTCLFARGKTAAGCEPTYTVNTPEELASLLM